MSAPGNVLLLAMAVPTAIIIVSGALALRLSRVAALQQGEQLGSFAKFCLTSARVGAIATVIASPASILWSNPLSGIEVQVGSGTNGVAYADLAVTEPTVPHSGLAMHDERGPRIQLVGGGLVAQWEDLPGQGGSRVLLLEAVGIDNVPDPRGNWTVCVGIPVKRVAPAGAGGQWSFMECHSHDGELDAGRIADRNRGLYQTYYYSFPVNERTAAASIALPALALNPILTGEHQIGVGLAHSISTSVMDFRASRDTCRLRVTTLTR